MPASTPAPVPHPSELLPLRGGERLLLRPIRPQDDWLLAELINRTAPAVRRLRFPSAVEHVYPRQLQRLVCVDGARHLALVAAATGHAGNEYLVAEGRYLIDPGGRSAEFALLVDPRWQRRGIGSALLRRLGQSAAAAGVTQLRAEVACDNLAMLGFMKHCRFRCTRDEAAPRVVQVASGPLHAPAPAFHRPAPWWHQRHWQHWWQAIGERIGRPAGPHWDEPQGLPLKQ